MSNEGAPGAAGDRLEFAEELFDRYAEEIYRYVLAWTGGRASAVDLTTQVLRTAVARMDRIVAGGDPAELEVRLVALARAAVTRWQAGGKPEGRAATVASEVTAPLFDGLGRLDDSQREALILCELLTYPAKRAARLLGCDRAVLEELRDTAAESLWREVHQAPAHQAVSSWERLTVGTALRQAAHEWLPPPGDNLLGHLRVQVAGEALARTEAVAPGDAPAPAPAPAPPPAPAAAGAVPGAAGPGTGKAGPGAALVRAPASVPALASAQPTGAERPRVTVADKEQGRERHLRHLRHLRQLLAAGLLPVLRRRWALGVAAIGAAGIGVVAALVIGGPASQSSQCGGAVPCLVTTTVEVPDTVEALPTSPPDPPTVPTTARTVGDGSGFPLVTGRTRTTGQFPSTTGPPTTTGPGRSTTTRRPTTTTTVHKTTTTIHTTTSSTGTTATTTANPPAPPPT